jgi:hypothetical protein
MAIIKDLAKDAFIFIGHKSHNTLRADFYLDRSTKIFYATSSADAGFCQVIKRPS